MPELSNYAICYEAIQRVYRNVIIREARRLLKQAYGDDWLKNVEVVFQKEWNDVVQAANEIRVTGFVGASLVDDFDCLGVNHFHNLFAKFFNELFPRSTKVSDIVREEERKAVLRFAKEVNDYRNAMSHPSESDLPRRDAIRLLDSACRLLNKIDREAAEKIQEYENRLVREGTGTIKLTMPHRPRQARSPLRPPDINDDVLVVPAGLYAQSDYTVYHAYFCQPYRRFRPVSRMAFYADGAILPRVPTVKGIVESVSFDEAGYDGIERAELEPAVAREAIALLSRLLNQGPSWARQRGMEFKMVLLSGPSDPGTFVLNTKVVNDKRSQAGRPTAFVQGQRYVSFSKLKMHPKVTSELE